MQALGPSMLPGELEYTHGVMLENAKNYQLWNHRRLCATAVRAGSGEDRAGWFSRHVGNQQEGG